MASLSAQRCQDYEWVVVDGASSDRTVDIARTFNSAPVSLISEPDKGIYDAMNKGVRMARGDYLFFLNSDDALHDLDVLTDVASMLDSHTAIDLIYGNVLYEQRPRRILRTFSHINSRTLPFEDLCHQAVFARRTLFNSVGSFNTKYRLNADYDWLIRVFSSGANCCWIDRAIAMFSVGGAHLLDPKALASERKQVRLQYMSLPKLYAGELARRVRHRFHRHFRPHPLGKVPFDQ